MTQHASSPLGLRLYGLPSQSCTRPRRHGACCYRKAAVDGDDMLDFLKGIVENVLDLGIEEEAPSPESKPKRRR